MKKSIIFIFLCLFLILQFLFLKYYVVGVYEVQSNSMNPTLKMNDRILISKNAYEIFGIEFSEPKAGEIIIFDLAGENLIKRIFAKEGDTVYIRRNLVKKKKFPDYDELIIIKEGKLFVLGDNLKFSKDSREFGTIDKKKIIGKYLTKLN